MAVATESGAFTTKFGFVAQRDVNDAAFAAIHRVEAEGFGRALDLLGGNSRAQAKFGDAEHAEVVGIEGDEGMIVIRDAQSLHRDVLKGKQHFGLIGEEDLDIGPFELDHNLWIFDLGIGRIARFDFVLDIKVGVVEDHVEKLFDARADGINGIFGFAQCSLPGTGILTGRGYDGAADIGRGHGLIKEPLLCDAHEVASEPV